MEPGPPDDAAASYPEGWEEHVVLRDGGLAFVHGLHHFEASMLSYNRRMIEVFRDAGFPRRLRREDGILEVSLDIDPTRHSREVIARRHADALAHARERLADARRDRP